MPPRKPHRSDAELRYVSLEEEALEDLGLAGHDIDDDMGPQTRGSLALARKRSVQPDLGPALDPDAPRQDKLDALRAHLQKVAPAPSVHRLPALGSGLPQLDDAVGGWPRPAVHELCGRPGTGRLSLLLPTMRRVAAGAPPLGSPRPVAIVDPLSQVHPPGLRDLPFDRILLIRPGTRALWAAEQLARSGALPLVLLVDPPPLGRAGRRLLHAAEAGGCAVFVLHEGAAGALPSTLRLDAAGHGRFRLTRGGPPGGCDIDLPAGR